MDVHAVIRTWKVYMLFYLGGVGCLVGWVHATVCWSRQTFFVCPSKWTFTGSWVILVLLTEMIHVLSAWKCQSLDADLVCERIWLLAGNQYVTCLSMLPKGNTTVSIFYVAVLATRGSFKWILFSLSIHLKYSFTSEVPNMTMEY